MTNVLREVLWEYRVIIAFSLMWLVASILAFEFPEE